MPVTYITTRQTIILHGRRRNVCRMRIRQHNREPMALATLRRGGTEYLGLGYRTNVAITNALLMSCGQEHGCMMQYIEGARNLAEQVGFEIEMTHLPFGVGFDRSRYLNRIRVTGHL